MSIPTPNRHQQPQPKGRTVSRWRALVIGATAALAVVTTAAWSTAANGKPRTARPAVTASGHEHHVEHTNDIVFGPAPDALPPGAQMAVLQGDPSAPGQLFTIRLRLPNGYVLPPHWHPYRRTEPDRSTGEWEQGLVADLRGPVPMPRPGPLSR